MPNPVGEGPPPDAQGQVSVSLMGLGPAVIGQAGVLVGETAAMGFLGGVDPKFHSPTGAYGESEHLGVVGASTGPANFAGAGVLGSGNQSGSDFDPAKGEVYLGPAI
jgi:hypothetical protein